MRSTRSGSKRRRTLAYLTSQTNTKQNNFTFASDALTAMLTEPEWDGIVDYAENGDPIYGYTDDGDDEDTNPDPITTKPTADDDNNPIVYGEDVAKNMLPGTVAEKDPTITNTCELDEWVAAKITFVYADGQNNAGDELSATDLAKIMDVIEIDYNADDTGAVWERTVGSDADDVTQEFRYNTKLESGKATEPLVTTVSVKDDATTEQINAVATIGGFQIFVEGYAAQGDAIEDYDAFATETITFANTPKAVE